MSPRTIVVDTPDALREMRVEIVRETILGLDTEFHSERRYHPELMLVQIANRNGDVWIVDPKTVPMPALGQALRQALIVTHGGQQDVKLLYRELRIRPNQLFDTQIAAGLLGYRYPLGLQALCWEVLEQEISKGESLTDWSKRPLSPEQISYAADDSRVLIPLYDALISRIQKVEKDKWLWQACDEMVESQLQPKSVGLSWVHWGVAETLDITAQRVLTNLLEWREEMASIKNQSPNYILPRSILLYLARTQPKSLNDIQNRRVHPTFLKRFGKQVIKVIEQGLQETDEFILPTAEQKERADILKMWVQLFAKEINVAPNLLLPQDTLEAITLNGVSILQNWRREVLIHRLKSFLRGNEYIILENGVAVLKSRQRFSESESA